MRVRNQAKMAVKAAMIKPSNATTDGFTQEARNSQRSLASQVLSLLALLVQQYKY
jgi:hypothetical protein